MRDRPNDQHRQLAEARLGRKLNQDEIVHHRNENKNDNSKANQEITSRSQHTTNHNKARNLSRLRRILRDKPKLY